MNSIENVGNERKKKKTKIRIEEEELWKSRQGVKLRLKYQTMRYFFNVNKPLLETLHYFAINGLSWKSRNGTKIEQICLRTNS